jgi:hypothetical protein
MGRGGVPRRFDGQGRDAKGVLMGRGGMPKRPDGQGQGRDAKGVLMSKRDAKAP